MSHRTALTFLLLATLTPSGCATPAEVSRPVPSDSGNASPLALASPAFSDGSRMPEEHAMPAAGGGNVSPPLAWSGAPEGTASFALECVDLAPIANEWVHWLVIDLPPDTTGLTTGASESAAMPPDSRELPNGFGAAGWGGPQPPRGTGAHRYRFTLYALDVAKVDLGGRASLDEFRQAVEAHALASASLTGTFER